MCPITAGVVITGAAATVGAVGSMKQAKAQSNAAKFNAAQAAQDAVAAQQQAQQAAQLQQIQAQKAFGATRAAYGAAGVTMDGTPLDVLAESAVTAERDKQTILYQGKLRAAGYQSESALQTAAASNAMTQVYFSAAGQRGGDPDLARSPAQFSSRGGL